MVVLFFFLLMFCFRVNKDTALATEVTVMSQARVVVLHTATWHSSGAVQLTPTSKNKRGKGGEEEREGGRNQ